MNRMTVAAVVAAFGAGTLSGSTLVEVLAAPRYYQKVVEFSLSATQKGNLDALISGKAGASCVWQKFLCSHIMRSPGVDVQGNPLPPVAVIGCRTDCKLEALSLTDVPDGAPLESD